MIAGSDGALLAALIAEAGRGPSGSEDLSNYTGQITAWDAISGTNVVRVNGGDIPNMRVVQSGIGVAYQVGDVVNITRRGTQWFINGKVGAPGAGAGNQIAAAQVSTFETSTSSSFGNLATYGPEVTVNIGSSRRCLVFISATIQANSSSGYISFQVTGASSIAPDNYRSAMTGTDETKYVLGGNSASVLLTADDELNSGLNTFTAKYRRDVFGPGTGADFAARRIIVIPF